MRWTKNGPFRVCVSAEGLMTEYQYTFKRGDVTYDLSITRDANGYFGKYTCNVCKTTTSVDRVFSSEADAAGRLQAVAYAEHHVRIHVLG